MDERERQARVIERRIAAVLLNDWDPLNILGDEDVPQDEYDSYVGGVYGLLSRKATPKEIAIHLSKLEERMGHVTAPEKLMTIAEKLCALDIRLSSA